MRGATTLKLIEAACMVLEDADGTGCDSDLKVVSTDALCHLLEALKTIDPNLVSHINIECDDMSEEDE